jgi:hypothetical protein
LAPGPVWTERERKREKENESATDFIAFILKIRVDDLLETFNEPLNGRVAIWFSV